MNIKRKLLAALFAAVSLSTISSKALAGVDVGVSIGYPGAYGVIGPSYVTPAPLYVVPRPVYIQPPAYIQYGQGYDRGFDGGSGRGHEWRERESRAAYWRDQQSRRHDSRDWQYEHHRGYYGDDHNRGNWNHR
jgi:hypothetical protein